MTKREYGWIVLLYTLIELDGEASKQEALTHIQNHNYWYRNDTNDTHPNKRPNEYKWRNEISYARQHMVEKGCMAEAGRDVWRITKSGRQYFTVLKEKALAVTDFTSARFTQVFWTQIQEAADPAPEEDADRELLSQLLAVDDAEPNHIPVSASSLDPSPKPKGNRYRYSGSKRVYSRDVRISHRALALAGYVCEIDNSHPSFQRRRSHHNYMEPHHLIPMSMTDQFDVSLDREQNIFCLCSNCHNQIHYGTAADVRKMLQKLFLSRQQELCGILGRTITLEELYRIYQV